MPAMESRISSTDAIGISLWFLETVMQLQQAPMYTTLRLTLLQRVLLLLEVRSIRVEMQCSLIPEG